MSTATRDDPLATLGDLFIAQSERPDHLTPVDPATLPAFARVLLITDGTVTHMLRAHFCEPVEVRVEAHDFTAPTEDDPWLGTPEGAQILVRDVTLSGASSGRLFARARSHIALDRLTPQMREDITTMRRSIGNVLLAHFSENRRELLWQGLTPRGCLERTYRVIAGGKPLMVITETFEPLIQDEIP
jgi:chorismate-pyruvate lyase